MSTPDLQMSMADLLKLPPTFDLETAGHAWGYGRTKSFQLAKAGEFPCDVMRKGRRYVVRKADLFDSLGIPAQFLFATDPAAVPLALHDEAAVTPATGSPTQSAA